MALRKIKIDSTVKYIAQGEQTTERAIKPKALKNCEQNKKLSKNKKVPLLEDSEYLNEQLNVTFNKNT